MSTQLLDKEATTSGAVTLQDLIDDKDTIEGKDMILYDPKKHAPSDISAEVQRQIIKLRKNNYCQWCSYAQIVTFGPNTCLRAGGISQDETLSFHSEECPFSKYPPDDSRAKSLVFEMNRNRQKAQIAWERLG